MDIPKEELWIYEVLFFLIIFTLMFAHVTINKRVSNKENSNSVKVYNRYAKDK